MRVAVSEATGRLQPEARLPRPAGPREREQADVVLRQEPGHLHQLLLAAQERRRGDGQIRLVEALQRREATVPELVDALGRRQVLEPVLAEVAETIRADQGGRRGRDQHLPAVAARGDAGGPVHVHPDVASVGQVRRAGVDAHADPDRACGKALERRGRRLERSGRSRERDEERVTLRVDLDTPLGAERLTQEAAMLRQSVGVRVGAELVQQLRRALDVGEEKGDGAGREIAPHRRMMRQI